MADYLPPEVLAVLAAVDAHLIWDNKNQPPRGHERYHPSAFGNCLRLMQYQRYEERGLLEGEKKEFDPAILRVFGNGHGMHDRWRSYFEGLGVLKGYWECTNPLCRNYRDDGTIIESNLSAIDLEKMDHKKRMHGKNELQGCFKPESCNCGWKKFHYHEIAVSNKEMNFYGHADMILDFSRMNKEKYKEVTNILLLNYLPKNPIVVDMKSINDYAYKDVSKGNPHKYYLVQLMIYANILDCEYGVLIYENKNNQTSCAFKVDRRSEDLFPQIKKQAISMNEMVDVRDEEGNIYHLLPPPRPDDKDSKDCSYCAYREICHSSDIWDDPDLKKKRKEFYGDLL